MFLFKVFGAKQADQRVWWDDLPQVVQIQMLQYLDRKSLNNLKAVSTSARNLIENVRGIDVIIPQRNFTTGRANGPGIVARETITDTDQRFLVEDMEGKRIFSLEIKEMVPSYHPFPFARFVQQPQRLKHLKLKYVDVGLLCSFLAECTNLTSFEYETGIYRPLPRGPMALILFRTTFAPVPKPATRNNLIVKIAQYPDKPHFQLANLRNITLVFNQMSYRFGSDWGNIVFFVVAAPPLPSLKKLKIEFNPKMRLTWKMHLMLLSCIGEFMQKTRNLVDFTYKSTLRQVGFFEHVEWLGVFRAIIRRWGSDSLKEVAEATIGVAPMNSFIMLTRQILSVAARNLDEIRKVNLELADTNEINVFTTFVRRIPNNNNIPINCKILEARPAGPQWVDTDLRDRGVV